MNYDDDQFEMADFHRRLKREHQFDNLEFYGTSNFELDTKKAKFFDFKVNLLTRLENGKVACFLCIY